MQGKKSMWWLTDWCFQLWFWERLLHHFLFFEKPWVAQIYFKDCMLGSLCRIRGLNPKTGFPKTGKEKNPIFLFYFIFYLRPLKDLQSVTRPVTRFGVSEHYHVLAGASMAQPCSQGWRKTEPLHIQLMLNTSAAWAGQNKTEPPYKYLANHSKLFIY